MKRASIVSLVVILGLSVGSFAQVLSGSWQTTASASVSPVTLGLDSELIVNYAVETWSFASDTVLDETGWTRQRFAATGTLESIVIASTVTFAPSSPSAFFTQWTTTTNVTLAGITIIGTFSLTPGNVQLVVDSSGAIGLVNVRGVMTLGDTVPGGVCDFGWQGVTVTIAFPFCCADITSALNVTCDGFQSLKFTATKIAIPALAWFTLDAALTFETNEKTLVLTPSFDFGVDVCFVVYVGMGTSNFVLSDITIKGLGLSCAIGGIRFTGQSYWGTGTKPSLLTGTPYWEAYQIATTAEDCCGPFDFDVTVYFLQNGLQLFDVGKVAGNLSIQLSTAFTFSTGLSIELTAPASVTWTLGFLVEW